VGVPVDTLQTTTKLTTPAVTEIPAQFSNANPAVNQPVVVTAPGFIFLPDAGIDFGSDPIIVTRAADGSSISFIAEPGATGIPNFTGVALDFLPAVPLSLPATTSVTVSSTVTALSGTATPATAPSIVIPAEGATSAFYDKGTFTGPDLSFDGGIGAQYYKLVVTESGDYTFTVNWDNASSDVDMVICSVVTCDPNTDDFLGSGVDQPESDTRTLAPGTYYFDAVLFAGPSPAWISLTIEHAPPSQ